MGIEMNTDKYLKTEHQIHIFGGSADIKDNDWTAHAGKEWYICKNTQNVIFFDKVQNKWHMGGENGLMYRNPSDKMKKCPLKNGIMIPANQRRGHAKIAKKKKVKGPTHECSKKSHD